MLELDLSSGWSVLQDVHDLGEKLSIYAEDWNPQQVGPAFSEWQPIDRLAHLQLLFSEKPYFGRELRYFNEHPWWYRLEFSVPSDKRTNYALLRFRGVDYFCKVWLNGQLLGEHEGYFAPFEFEVGNLLKSDGRNILVVKVWSPWDKEVLPGLEKMRMHSVVRDMVKGTYEHADTFVQRDVNPIGLWGNVQLVFHSGVRIAGKPIIDTELSSDLGNADVKVVCPIIVDAGTQEVTLQCSIQEEDTGVVVATAEKREIIKNGKAQFTFTLPIQAPKLWWTWDHGEPGLYRAIVEVSSGGEVVQRIEERFGIRSIELHRTEQETTFILNGKRIFLRGTAYFPDVYVSNMFRARYYRDLEAIRRAGCNAVRVHVHVENPDFYDLCDELGIAVIQDSDLNWVHPTSEEWKDRAIKIFGDMIRELRNHPSIISWICLNEPHEYSKGYLLNECPGPQLVAEAARLDPRRPTIRGSGAWDDIESGDSHNYKGSLSGESTHYTDIFGEVEKLNTEFGFDAPACVENLRLVPEIFQRLEPIIKDIYGLQYYQYRLLKYYIEHYRIGKYRPCSGYFQFMFIDLCPQSFYGVYDWWGIPKEGLKALEESNQPLGIFMEYRDKPAAIWVVNDLPRQFPECSVEWIVLNEKGAKIASGKSKVDLKEDCSIRVADLSFPVKAGVSYRVSLFLRDSKGKLLAKNVYNNPFQHPSHPEGHPGRMSHEIGMRLYWA